MRKYTITVGTTTKQGVQLNQETVESLSDKYTAKISAVCGGCTKLYAKGGWLNESELITEQVVVLYACGEEDHYNSLLNIALDIRDDFEQHCVAFEVSEVDFSLV